MQVKPETLTVSDDAWLELMNLDQGVFAPLTGFLGHGDYLEVVHRISIKHIERRQHITPCQC